MGSVRFCSITPPFAVLAAAKVAGVDVTPKPDANLPKDTVPVLTLPDGNELAGVVTILRYLARAGSSAGLYGSDALSSTQVDQWLDFLPMLAPGAGLAAACAYVDSMLALRTTLVGHHVTLADVALWGCFAGTPQFAVVTKGGKCPHLLRWYNFCSAQPVLAGVLDEFGRKKPTPATAPGKGSEDKAAKTSGSFDIKLEDARMGEVVTRFPPEPSGYLHIGHAKAALLNQYFANTYKGKLIVRFDDTNPSKENCEFEESILADLDRLDIKADLITHSSDHFEALLKMGEKLIKEGTMYIDDTPTEKMREERMVGTESKARNNTVDENEALWKEMVAGSARGQECCARFKMDMQNKNKALRDPVAFRCNLTPHHKTGTRFKLYPTYDCACPYVDAAEGVTHALRTSEYADRDAQFQWVQKLMGVRKVHIWEYSRLNFVYTVLSKRKLQWFVDTGRVPGWTDPRFPTVQGITRRGMQVEALKEFILSQGASKNCNNMEWDKLWTINKKVIDPVCARHTAVLTKNKVPLTLTNGPASPEVKIVPRHKKCEAAGKKATTMMSELWLDQADAAAVKEGEEVTLMDWGNCFVRSVVKGPDGAVTAVTGELHLAGDVKKTKLKLTWLPQLKDLVDLTLVDYGHLITKKKIEEGDNFEDFVNNNSQSEEPALGDANMRNLKHGEVIQIERKGYYICDKVYSGPGNPAIMLSIPDGRSKGMMN